MHNFKPSYYKNNIWNHKLLLCHPTNILTVKMTINETLQWKILITFEVYSQFFWFFAFIFMEFWIRNKSFHKTIEVLLVSFLGQFWGCVHTVTIIIFDLICWLLNTIIICFVLIFFTIFNSYHFFIIHETFVHIRFLLITRFIAIIFNSTKTFWWSLKRLYNML